MLRFVSRSNHVLPGKDWVYLFWQWRGLVGWCPVGHETNAFHNTSAAAGLEQDPLRRDDGGALAGGGCLMVGYAEY